MLKIILHVTHNFLHVYNFKDINLDINTLSHPKTLLNLTTWNF